VSHLLSYDFDFFVSHLCANKVVIDNGTLKIVKTKKKRASIDKTNLSSISVFAYGLLWYDYTRINFKQTYCLLCGIGNVLFFVDMTKRKKTKINIPYVRFIQMPLSRAMTTIQVDSYIFLKEKKIYLTKFFISFLFTFF